MKRTAPEHCELLARGNDQLHAGFLTQNAAVEAQIIVLRLSPVAACVIFVLDAALLVLFRQALLRIPPGDQVHQLPALLFCQGNLERMRHIVVSFRGRGSLHKGFERDTISHAPGF